MTESPLTLRNKARSDRILTLTQFLGRMAGMSRSNESVVIGESPLDALDVSFTIHWRGKFANSCGRVDSKEVALLGPECDAMRVFILDESEGRVVLAVAGEGQLCRHNKQRSR